MACPPLFLWPAVLLWACLPLGLPYFYGLSSPIFMACCIVLGLPPSGSSLFVWPVLPYFYGLLYCRGVYSVRIFPSGFFPSGSGFPKHGNFLFLGSAGRAEPFKLCICSIWSA